MDGTSIIDIIGLPLAVLGALSAFLFLLDRWYPIRKLSWRRAEVAARRMTEHMARDGYLPTLIVGIGRGGAIMGALISGCLGHRPLVVIDRKYVWKGGRRIDDMVLHLHLPKGLTKQVLLVAGEAHTGNTMRLYYEYFVSIGSEHVRRAAFYVQQGCVEKIEYVGLHKDRDLLMPWMFHQDYIRDSRSEEEARQLEGLFDSSEKENSRSVRTVLLIRHGESEDNDGEERYSGSRDPKLTMNGISQAKQVGSMLANEGVGQIFTSPLRRAFLTAQVIQEATGAQMYVDDRLREIDFGEWEGMTHKQIEAAWPEYYAQYEANPVKYSPPSGESPESVRDRGMQFWREAIRIMVDTDCYVMAVVAHNTILRILITQLGNKDLSTYRAEKLPNGSITAVSVIESGEAVSVSSILR